MIASIGGWTFPSAFYSDVMSTAENRATFIKAIAAYTSAHGFDGVDLDWEYPCSTPRTDDIKMSCWSFRHVTDLGGNCPSKEYAHGVCSGACNDKENLAAFVKEFKTAHPELYLSLAATAGTVAMEKGYDVPTLDKYLDHWNVMSYDYYVSDIPSQNITAPNQNLNDVAQEKGWSVSSSISLFKQLGATPSKLLLGVAYYGHTYYVPHITDDSW